MDTAVNISLTILPESLGLLSDLNHPIPRWNMPRIPISLKNSAPGSATTAAEYKIFHNRLFKQRPDILVNDKPVLRNGENYHIWFQINDRFPGGRWYINQKRVECWGSSVRGRGLGWGSGREPTEREYKDTTDISSYSFNSEVRSGINQFMIIVAGRWVPILVDVQMNLTYKLDTETALSLAREILTKTAECEEVRHEKLKMKVLDRSATEEEIVEFLGGVGVHFVADKKGRSSGSAPPRRHSSRKGGCARGGANTKRDKKSKKSKRYKKSKKSKRYKKSKKSKRRKNKRRRHR